MIGKLSGKIDTITSDHLILDVAGVGYIIFASTRTLTSIGHTGEFCALLVHTQVREDAITLYGFKDVAEQQWFKLLTTVQGVGAKAALSILSTCAPSQLGVIIASQDKVALTRADGVGPKLASRILSELKDKVAIAETFAPVQVGSCVAANSGHEPVHHEGMDQDAISALTNLGYARAEAYNAIMRARESHDNDNEPETLQTLITRALKELGA